jgi:hypothetical protein
MTMGARTWSAIASSAFFIVPVLPAFSTAPSMSVISTGRLIGKTPASAAGAVTTRPMTAVAIVRSERLVPEISVTEMPWR